MDPETQNLLLPLLLFLTLGAGVLAWLIGHGHLGPRAFEKAPERPGHLGPGDLLAGLMLTVLAPVVVILIARPMLIGQDPYSPDMILAAMLLSKIGYLPAIVYILYRVQVAMPEGLRGFGLGGKRFLRGLPTVFRVLLAIIPLLMATSIIISWISQQFLGIEPPELAHPALRALIESDNPMTQLLIVLSAIILAPALEETVFRGLVQTGLVQSGKFTGRWMPIILASLLFMLMHVGSGSGGEPSTPTPAPAPPVPATQPQMEDAPSITAVDTPAATQPAPVETQAPPTAQPPKQEGSGVAWQALPILFVLALGLGYVYERTGSLWATILFHGIFNALNIGLALLAAG